MENLISIIIPTYNRVSYLGATLDSVLNQTYRCWECIVVDDDSTDYTKELMSFYCEKDSRFQYFQRPEYKIKGANSCRNYGFKKSKGKYINWFDSDDLMHPDFLKERIEISLTKNADCCICLNNSFIIRKGKMIKGRSSQLSLHKLLENICLQKYSVPTHAPLWTRRVLKNELFDESLQISQDLEFHSRFLSSDLKIVLVSKKLFYLRIGHERITEQFYKNISKYFSSYFKVRQILLQKFANNQVINSYYKNELMGVFRYLLAIKDYEKALSVLDYLYSKFAASNFKIRITFFKIYFMYWIIKILGRGETRFKKFFYLNS